MPRIAWIYGAGHEWVRDLIAHEWGRPVSTADCVDVDAPLAVIMACAALRESDMVLLLVTSPVLSLLENKAVLDGMRRARERGAQILPLVVAPCAWRAHAMIASIEVGLVGLDDREEVRRVARKIATQLGWANSAASSGVLVRPADVGVVARPTSWSTWLPSSREVAVRVVSGGSAALHALAAEAFASCPSRWDVGWLRPDVGLAALRSWSVERDSLVVVERCDTRVEVLAPWLRSLAASSPSRRLRIVLLESTDEPGGSTFWWTDVFGRGSNTSAGVRTLLDPSGRTCACHFPAPECPLKAPRRA